MDTIEGKIEGNMVLEDDKPRVDKILFSAGSDVNITNKYIKEDKIYIEGIAKTYIVYLNDETNSINSVELEIPFTVNDKFEGEEREIFASAVIYDSDVAVKKGRELFYDAKIKISINYCSDAICGSIWNCANSNNIVSRTKVTRALLNPQSFEPQQIESVEMMEFERLKQSYASGLFKGL